MEINKKSSKTSSSILLILLLSINVSLIGIILYQSNVMNKYKSIQEENFTYTVALEEVIKENTKFAVECSKSSFDPFINLGKLNYHDCKNYKGVIIPFYPCRSCLNQVIELIDQNSNRYDIFYIIFVPPQYQHDFKARFYTNPNVQLVNCTNEVLEYSELCQYLNGDFIVYYVENGELGAYFKSSQIYSDNLQMII